ncbi:ABC transporter permease [Escherichia coli]|uniref:ABC transporter permease n=1 Tax=Escherichia coli TaxID=562 RepID=A0A377B7X8_ECOLX|nr:ABC transporter permease [Escherichia coli]
MLTLIKDSLPVPSPSIVEHADYLSGVDSVSIRKAVYNGSRLTSGVAHLSSSATPSGLFVCHPADCLLRGRQLFDLFPLRGLVSANLIAAVVSENHRLSVAYHAAGAGDSDWWLCGADHADKKLIPDEVRKQYVVTARAKGVSEKNILWKHVFRNAMLPGDCRFPATFISMFFTGSLLIE